MPFKSKTLKSIQDVGISTNGLLELAIGARPGSPCVYELAASQTRRDPCNLLTKVYGISIRLAAVPF